MRGDSGLYPSRFFRAFQECESLKPIVQCGIAAAQGAKPDGIRGQDAARPPISGNRS
ncbi:hypothetical protein DB31_8022 [Hyalangium minutum]|uniref:Uncharacterized protein n=1 Tax=Hyalangium minutum TaxID=394096 RepID=A0A085WIM6_9BACT|nr:hypothetical protein DB31_8022 [Hyalangium minutum]